MEDTLVLFQELFYLRVDDWGGNVQFVVDEPEVNRFASNTILIFIAVQNLYKDVVPEELIVVTRIDLVGDTVFFNRQLQQVSANI